MPPKKSMVMINFSPDDIGPRPYDPELCFLNENLLNRRHHAL